MSDGKILRPVVFMSRTAGVVDDPAIRDFRPANEVATPPRTVAPMVTVEVDEVPKVLTSSAIDPALGSASDTSENSTPGSEEVLETNPNSSSESSETPASAVKGKLLQHPSTKPGKIEPPAGA